MLPREGGLPKPTPCLCCERSTGESRRCAPFLCTDTSRSSLRICSCRVRLRAVAFSAQLLHQGGRVAAVLSWLNAESCVLIASSFRQAKDPLTDNIMLNFVGAGRDRGASGGQHAMR